MGPFRRAFALGVPVAAAIACSSFGDEPPDGEADAGSPPEASIPDSGVAETVSDARVDDGADASTTCTPVVFAPATPCGASSCTTAIFGPPGVYDSARLAVAGSEAFLAAVRPSGAGYVVDLHRAPLTATPTSLTLMASYDVPTREVLAIAVGATRVGVSARGLGEAGVVTTFRTFSRACTSGCAATEVVTKVTDRGGGTAVALGDDFYVGVDFGLVRVTGSVASQVLDTAASTVVASDCEAVFFGSVQSDAVYRANKGGVLQIANAAGDAAAGAFFGITAIAVDQTDVFVSTLDTRTFFKTPKATATRMVAAPLPLPPGASAILADSRFLYYVDGPNVMRAGKDGTSPTPMASFIGALADFAQDGSFLYLTAPSGQITRISK